MTRKDYAVLALAIRDHLTAYPVGKDRSAKISLIRAITTALRRDNPRFDTELFLNLAIPDNEG